MCFSATASFGASVMLASVGTVAFIKAKTTSLKVLALIPFIFSIQQFSEGWVWLSLTKDGFAIWKRPSMYAFLFFAELAWPICISYSMMQLEKKGIRKNILKGLFYTSLALFSVMSYSLYYYHADVVVMGNHVMYSIDTSDSFKSNTNLIYFLTAVLPPFLSSVKRAWLMGVVLLLSYVIVKIYYEDYIISIWCYFATLICFIILWMIWEYRRITKGSLK